MIVRFVFRDYNAGGYQLADPVSYAWTGPVPAVDEQVEADGSDPAMPEQIYYVRKVVWLVTLRGLDRVDIHVEPQDPGAWRGRS